MKLPNKLLTIFTLMTIISVKMVAQDIHFSQFYASPLALSPAQTGWYKGDLRVSSNYRSQWKSIDQKPFQTVSLGLEKQYYHYSNSYSFGAFLLSDKSGYVGLITDKLLLSGSFTTRYKGNKITAGVQVGGIYKYTYTLQYTYDNQFDLGGQDVFNQDFATLEERGNRAVYLTTNVGIMWTKRFSKRFMPEAGISFFNLNKPSETFFDASNIDYKLPIRTALHAGGKYSIDKRLHFCPNFLYMSQHKATDMLLGTNVEYDITNDMTIYGGTVFRYGLQKNYDASSWIGGVKYKNLNVGLSYDINISTLQQATKSKGAFEISLIYITPSLQSNFIKIPCDRL